MPQVVAPIYADRPPLAPLGINWRNPISRQLVVSFVPTVRFDQVQRGVILDTGTKGSIIGNKLSVTTGSGTSVSYGDLSKYAGARQFTSLSVVIPRSLNVRGALWATPNVALCMGYGDSSKVFAYSNAGSTEYLPEAVAGFFVAGERISVAWRFDRDASSYHSIFKNGIFATNGNGISTTTLNLGSLYLGGNPTFSTHNSADVDIEVLLFWARALSDAEIRDISLNPWQVFEPEPIQIYWSSIGGSTLIDLTASSFRFTGQSIQPKTTVNLSTNNNFLFSGKTIKTSLVSRLSAATFRFTANSIAVGGQIIIDLSRATFNFVGKAINTIQNTAIQLGAASFRFIGNSITVTGAIAAVKRGGGMMMMLARKLTRRYRDKIGKHE